MLLSIALSVAVLAITWSILLTKLESDRRSVLDNIRMQQESLAAMISENLSQVLHRGSLLALAAGEITRCDPEAALPMLNALQSTDRAFIRLMFINIDGYSSEIKAEMSSTSAMNEALNEFATLIQLAPTIAPRFGPRPTEAVQSWQVPLFFPVLREGKSCGILVTVLDLGYFLSFYQKIDLGVSGAIELIDTNGSIIVRARSGGIDFLAPDQRSRIHELITTERGSIEVADSVGEPALQASFRRLEAFPVWVSVSRELNELLQDHLNARHRVLLTLSVFSLFVVGATIWIVTAMRRGERLVTRLARSDNEKRRLILALQDEKHRAYELASHDHLTGLPNRRMFFELGGSHLARAKRSRQFYGLMYLDLDRFKTINDSLGHHVGDLLLQTVAARMRSVLRESDVVARLGGDEFVALLTGLDRREDLATIAGKLTDVIGRPCLNLDGHDLQVTPSIGVAIFPRDGHDIETLSRHADAAMYESKRAGRGRITFYDPALNPVSDRQFDLEQGLGKAIAENELILHFQPKVRLIDYKITGFEALVRWQHPEFGLIYPQEFIDLAETMGMTTALGNWVAEACCRQLASWRAEGVNALPIAINVSARQLADESLPSRLAELLNRFAVPGELLEIEITENSLLESLEVAGQILRQLEAMGITIALDDFGNGYSSLGYIRTLPIHTIKIDRSFVNDLRNSSDDEIIVGSIITLAHNLKKRVVAEGVELIEQLIHLKTAGCDEVQGFYLCRPASADAAKQLLADGAIKLPLRP